MIHTDVAKGIHRIEDAYTNWYLVEEGGRLTVVDCGTPASWDSFLIALDRVDRSRSDVEAILLTHAHFDHVGFAERARRELKVPVFVHEEDVPLTKRPMSYDHERSRLPYLLIPKALPIVAALTRHRAFWPTPIEKVEAFRDGVLPVPGSPEVVYTPGHTYGHCAFHLPDRDAVIAGDSLVMLDPYTGSTGPQIVSRAATADSHRNLDTLSALAGTNASHVLTGHGEPWDRGAGEAVRLARIAGPS